MNSEELLQADSKIISNALKIRFYPITVKAAKGTKIIDHQDKEYLDLTAGWAVANTGYGDKRVADKLQEQYEALSFTTQLSAPEENMVHLAEKLISIIPGDFEKKVWFGHSGSDANECIAKLVPLSQNKPRMLSFMGGYHGQTLGSMSLSGHPAQSKFIGSGNVVKVPYPNPYRPLFGSKENLTGNIIDFIESEVFTTISPPEDTAGIVVEGIQSDGGLVVPPDDFLPELKKLCEDHNIYLIMDEVKVGLGRTGEWFSFDHASVAPDAVVLGKPLGGGMPISAVVGRKDILDAGTAVHMFTASGNPLSSAAALETLSIIKEEKLIRNAKEIGEYFSQQLCELQARYEIIGDVRGKGLAIGVELVEDGETKTPAIEETAAVCYRSYELGLLVYYVGIHSNVIEITPPLTITKEEVDFSISVLDQAFKDLEEKKIDIEKVRKYSGW
ncbi:aspartate aminotransferase family protein [Virgibacillus sp. C22-A2]|uniref:Aspartate aminotransferase family protein n=1 Tax=Virgibacillus tibetensis TaxID=3042313 RepID=A0ABU6KD18_9BACI|nr:aspartate aminotransferase family protein [Virgibacillus sp. C22-A2]